MSTCINNASMNLWVSSSFIILLAIHSFSHTCFKCFIFIIVIFFLCNPLKSFGFLCVNYFTLDITVVFLQFNLWLDLNLYHHCCYFISSWSGLPSRHIAARSGFVLLCWLSSGLCVHHIINCCFVLACPIQNPLDQIIGSRLLLAVLLHCGFPSQPLFLLNRSIFLELFNLCFAFCCRDIHYFYQLN